MTPSPMYVRLRLRAGWLSLCLAVMLVLPRPVAAYHFFHVLTPLPLPVAWRTLPVAFVVDNTPGTFSPIVQSAFNAWNNVPTAAQIFGAITPSPVDLTVANYQVAGGWGFLTADGQQEVVCDSDGTVLARLGLSATTTLGYGPSLRQFVGGQGAITDAFFVLNCSIPQSADFNYLGTMVHELGHDIGLAHTATYQDAAERLDPLPIGSAPTMYPYSIPGNDAASATLEADDIAGISELYPDPTFNAAYGTLSGTVTRCGTDEPVLGVNVRAVSTTNSNVQITRYTGYDGDTTSGAFAMRVPAGTYKLIIEVMGLKVGAMAMLTRVDKDFPTEYLSTASDETGCLEELPDTSFNTTVAGAGTAGNLNFKTNPVELAFVVDDTGSMGPEIGAVRTILTNQISRLVASGQPFPTTAIVSFKDNVTVRRISRNPTVLQGVVNSLVASGGGDCPEHSNDALLAAGRLLRRGGKAMLFTDADSHPTGASAATVSALYTSKSMRLSVELSGSCTSVISALDGDDASQMDPANSQNPDDEPAGVSIHSREPTDPPLGTEGSVQTFSTVTTATGGALVTIPGIKTGNATETQRYINTGTNVAVSATLPTVALTSPGTGPVGATIDVDVVGSNTNFQNASVLTFSGTGITLTSRVVRSATLITATVAIAPGAALGFRDVTVTTPLGGGSVETALGVGAFNIGTAPAVPTVTSVTPASGVRGTSVDVTIRAVAATFTAASTPIFCLSTCTSVVGADPNVVVTSTTLVDATTLRARIAIAPTATVAYRNVSVVTGAQVATETVVGPFLISAATPTIGTIVSVSPNSAAQGLNLDVTITGNGTAFVNGTSVASFSGGGITVNSTSVSSPTTAVANITIDYDAALGFHDVLVDTAGDTAVLLNGFSVLSSPPTARRPIGFYVSSIVGNTVTFRWTPPTGGLPPTDYVLEGGISPGQVLASLPVGNTTPIFTIIAPTGAFYARLHTMSGAIKSLASNEVRLFVNVPAAPSAPVSLTAMVNGTSVSLAWRNTFGGGAPTALALDVTGSLTTTLPLPLTDSFSVAGAPPGTYTLRVRASNAAGVSGFSNPVTITIPSACTGAPVVPSNVLAYAVGRQVTVLWDAPTTGPAATSYMVNVSGAFTGAFPVAARTIGGTVAPGTYNLSVAAVNACGTGPASAVQTVVVP